MSVQLHLPPLKARYTFLHCVDARRVDIISAVMAFYLKMSLDVPRVKERPLTPAEVAAKNLKERKEQILRDSFQDKSSKKPQYLSPYLTCKECNHIAFIDAFNLKKRLDAVLRGSK